MSILSFAHTTIFETNTDKIQEVESICQNFGLDILKSPDYFELRITEKQSIGIKETREMINWLQFKPYQFEHKLACIVNADKMTLEAQNSLLKTLEEPPANTYIVLLTPNHKRLIKTIISRARVLQASANSNSKNASHNEIENHKNEESSPESAPSMILAKPLKEQIKWIEDIAKIRNPAEKKQFVYNFLETLHKEITTDLERGKPNAHSNNEQQIYLRKLELIEKTYEGLRRNVSIKLLLENLLFNFQ